MCGQRTFFLLSMITRKPILGEKIWKVTNLITQLPWLLNSVVSHLENYHSLSQTKSTKLGIIQFLAKGINSSGHKDKTILHTLLPCWHQRYSLISHSVPLMETRQHLKWSHFPCYIKVWRQGADYEWSSVMPLPRKARQQSHWLPPRSLNHFSVLTAEITVLSHHSLFAGKITEEGVKAQLCLFSDSGSLQDALIL